MTQELTSQKLQVFFDGACPLCSREARHFKARDREHRLDWIDIAGAGFDARVFGLDPQRIQQVMHVRAPDGRVYTEVDAFMQMWRRVRSPFTTPLLWLLKVPGMKSVARVLYRLFARNRYRLTGRCTPESCEVNHRA